VLKRCLEKDPENRWQSAKDLKAALELIVEAGHVPPLEVLHLPTEMFWLK
jgi:hypothetical protein